MKVVIPVFPGTNCEKDTAYAVSMLGAEAILVWYQETTIPECDCVIVPGGFSYGDYLRSGAIARFSPVMKAISDFASQGGKVLGICNGFQILLEAGLLPGAIKRNKNLHFISKFHSLRVINNDNDFLHYYNQGDIVTIPVAHADGSYYIAPSELEELYNNHQVLLKYATLEGNDVDMNGAIDNIAGICNKTKNVFGLMPHPERAIEEVLGSTDGINMLKGFLGI